MFRHYSWLLTLIALEATSVCAVTPPAAKVDKARLEAYIRYAEGFTPNVKIMLDDPAPSAFNGFLRLVAHVSLGAQKVDRTYYLTANGQIVNGSIWNLNESPFAQTLQQLPSGLPSFGPADAKVTIVIFSDFQCPYCRQLARTVRENIPKTYPAEVHVAFADFPLDSIHHWAHAMAEAAHCIGDGHADDFWAFHDWVFDNQQEFDNLLEHKRPLNAEDLAALRNRVLSYAKDHKLDTARIEGCLDNHATTREVDEQQHKGQLLGVEQTPTLFVNGRPLGGAVPWKTIDDVVKMELQRPKDIAVLSNQNCCEVTIPRIAKK